MDARWPAAVGTARLVCGTSRAARTSPVCRTKGRPMPSSFHPAEINCSLAAVANELATRGSRAFRTRRCDCIASSRRPSQSPDVQMHSMGRTITAIASTMVAGQTRASRAEPKNRPRKQFPAKGHHTNQAVGEGSRYSAEQKREALEQSRHASSISVRSGGVALAPTRPAPRARSMPARGSGLQSRRRSRLPSCPDRHAASGPCGPN